jgi:predicted ATPase
MLVLTEITIENFKCFNEKTVLPIGKFTLLTGVNGKGKSTVIQSLLLPSQSLLKSTEGTSLILNGDWVELGSYDDVRSSLNSSNSNIKFSYEFQDKDSYFQLHTEFTRNYLGEAYGDLEDEGSLGLKSVKIKSSTFGLTNVDTFNLTEITEPVDFDNVRGFVSGFEKITFISADRIGPRTFHTSNLNANTGVGKNGENTALAIYKSRLMQVTECLRMEGSEINGVPEQVSAWIGYIFKSGSVKVDSISESLKQIKLNTDGSIYNYKPENVGYGFSYCLPIIVAGLTAKAKDILIVENPEAHLHPSAQNRITKFLCLVAKSGVNVIVETHSPSILNGVRLSVKANDLNADETSVLFFGEGDKQLKRVMIEEGGLIEEWPIGFFDQDEVDLDKLHDL